MASNVSIANRALLRIGANTITSFSDESKEAVIMNEIFEEVRDGLLREVLWKFAIKRAVLAADVTTPSYEFDLAYSLPSDFIRLDKIENLYENYKIEGRKILTNQAAPLYMRYGARITDPNLFDTLFRECLMLKLAAESCYNLVQSQSMAERLEGLLDIKIKNAKTVQSKEDIPDAISYSDDWIFKRF